MQKREKKRNEKANLEYLFGKGMKSVRTKRI